MATSRILAIDQYGNSHRLTGKHPRKELIERLGASNASKMYEDHIDGKTYHVGYVIDGAWYKFYTVTPWEKEQ